jgi:hypothetical protein
MRATHIQASGCIAACQTYGVSCHPERLIPFGFVVAWTDSTGGYGLDRAVATLGTLSRLFETMSQ